MDDPIQRHPTRAEQLDILVTAIADVATDGDTVLELGCGAGYVAHLILQMRPGLSIVGVDHNPEALQRAAEVLPDGVFKGVVGNLERIKDIPASVGGYRAIFTALTFHDLPDAAKRTVLSFAARQLAPGGVFLLYDRIRLTEPALFPLQQSIWSRIERVYGRAMRTADTFEAYVEDLGTDNRPASLAEYLEWFPKAGLTPQILHLHGNVALIAGAARN